MVDQTRNKDEKAGQQSGAPGSDKKDHVRNRSAVLAVPSKKNPNVTIHDDDESTPGKKSLSEHPMQKPAGGQEGMRPKVKKEEDEEGHRGTKSRNTPNSKG